LAGVEEFAEEKIDPLVVQAGDLDPLSTAAELPVERRFRELYQRGILVVFEIVG
jgi:hypothetical protein